MNAFEAAAKAIAAARNLIITAGAGMGVDSGLPDFRGVEGFWQAYPPYARLGIRFEEAANPAHFARDPAFGWGFYGHRLDLYRRVVPHPGFRLILDWVDCYRLDYFVVTSNVDGQFQKAGYTPDRILEVHGSIHHLQCSGPCCQSLWENQEEVPVDTPTMRATRFPRCPSCGQVARPNILMFGDWDWISARSDEQAVRFDDFLSAREGAPAVILELGAGTAIPTIRSLGERLSRRPCSQLIRINPHEPGTVGIAIATGAFQGLQGIETALAGG